MNKDRFGIGKTHISITNTEHTYDTVLKAVANKENGYICVSNLRTVMLANKDKDYCEVMNQSYMNIPDGTPLVWCGKMWGAKNAQRSSGPDLFVKFLTDGNKEIKHFLLGDTEETLAKIKKKYHDANIVGTYSPPFKPVEEYDFEAIAKAINDSGADIVWTSLRAPKQDILGNKLLPYTDAKIMIGVGAAFRYSLGESTLPPELIRKLGISGLWLRKNKSKTSIWYLKSAFSLSKYLGQILVYRLMGRKYYE